MQPCVFCQQPVEPTTQRCLECGRVQSDTSDAQLQDITIPCPYCGELLPALALFCRHCGQAFPQVPPNSTLGAVATDAGKVLPQETTRSASRMQQVFSPPSDQLFLPDDKPAYLQGITSLFTDVFISYSRKDKAFVRQLFQALAAANRPVWVDWDDIPPTTDWQQEIYTEGRN